MKTLLSIPWAGLNEERFKFFNLSQCHYHNSPVVDVQLNKLGDVDVSYKFMGLRKSRILDFVEQILNRNK